MNILPQSTVVRKSVVQRRGPGVARMAGNFAKAYASHVIAGRPQATDEQVAERFAICQGCELYKSTGEGRGQCLHESCGCYLKLVGVNGLNKLRWADQACPLGKWQAVSPPQAPDPA